MLAVTLLLFKKVPGSFLPVEDQGYLYTAVIMPDAASLDRTQAVSARARERFSQDPAVDSVAEAVGFSLLDGQIKPNAGILFVTLKDFKERLGRGADVVISEARRDLSAVSEGIVMPLNPPSIPGLGTAGGFEFWLQSKGDASVQRLEEVTQALIAEGRKRPELAGLSTTINTRSRQMLVEVDRERAETQGVATADVYAALQAMFGSLYVSQFPKSSRLLQVILQADARFRDTPEDLELLYVRNKAGQMVPIKAVTTWRYVTGADVVTRFNNFPAAKIVGDAAPGFSSGQALAAMEQLAREQLPPDFGYEWSGQAFEERSAGSTAALVFVFALVMVFLILAAQYEKWTLPLGVLMAVPFALFGALLAIFLRGIENDVYFQIGLTVLIALAAKNAILVFEFAIELRHKEGLSAYQATMQAAKLRLRPVVMTSLAFILGCVPLAIATGASSASRHSLGTGVIGGMLGATLIAMIFIPMFFWALETLAARGAPAEGAAPSPHQE
jgi:multidrug efflux pump